MADTPPRTGPRPAGARRPALVAAGVVALLFGIVAAVAFAANLSQYLTIDDTWGQGATLSPETRRFGTALVKHAAFHRLFLFGPLGLGLGVLGIALVTKGRRPTNEP